MLPEYLLPVTTVRESGYGPIINIGAGGERTSILTLKITRITEREGLRVSIWGSMDQSEWESAPLASFTNKFYCGEYDLELDLDSRPDVRYLRVEWDLDNGRRLGARPLCTMSLLAHAPSEHLVAVGA